MRNADCGLWILARVAVVTVWASVAAADNLDYWLSRAKPATQPAATQTAKAPADRAASFVRDDALPGVIELSDGTCLAGGIYGTRDTSWKVWIEADKRWRLVPPIAVLSMTAVVVEERMELQWRWKETGSPEKIYTGKRYPMRRLRWRIRLIDGTVVTGAIKGQPIWIETARGVKGPMLLPERQKGETETTLADLVYVRRVIISRRLMDAVRAEEAEAGRDGHR